RLVPPLTRPPFPTRRTSDLQPRSGFPVLDVSAPFRQGEHQDGSHGDTVDGLDRGVGEPQCSTGAEQRPQPPSATTPTEPSRSRGDRKSTRLNSSHGSISYAV